MSTVLLFHNLSVTAQLQWHIHICMKYVWWNYSKVSTRITFILKCEFIFNFLKFCFLIRFGNFSVTISCFCLALVANACDGFSALHQLSSRSMVLFFSRIGYQSVPNSWMVSYGLLWNSITFFQNNCYNHID